MKIAIDISEAVNGYRLDIYDEVKTYKENVRSRDEALLFAMQYLSNRLQQKPVLPTDTMSVI